MRAAVVADRQAKLDNFAADVEKRVMRNERPVALKRANAVEKNEEVVLGRMCEEAARKTAKTIKDSVTILPPNVDNLTRHDLAVLGLRINPCWSMHHSWTKEMILQRLRSWESEIRELFAAMTCVFTDACCSLQYGVVDCVI